jgi:hypothetical protein
MTNITHALLPFAILAALWVDPAQAQLARTFVSSMGNDANDCGRLTPCRTFQRAHDNTLANGEITVLDPGGYGAVTITKGISIINDGVGEAGVLVSSGLNGITINAGNSEAVSLRGLTVKGIGFGGGNGIVFNRGKILTVENCAIRGLTGGAPIGYGIKFLPDAVVGPGVSSGLAVSNTFVASNDNDGILVQPTGSNGRVRAVFTRVETHGNGANGISIDGRNSLTEILTAVSDSVAATNVGTGFFIVSSANGSNTNLMVSHSVASNNGVGIFASGTNATLRVTESMMTGNSFGWLADGGAVVLSYADNAIDGNFDGQTPPPVTPKK